jgi:hypothetical protein
MTWRHQQNETVSGLGMAMAIHRFCQQVLHAAAATAVTEWPENVLFLIVRE